MAIHWLLPYLRLMHLVDYVLLEIQHFISTLVTEQQKWAPSSISTTVFAVFVSGFIYSISLWRLATVSLCALAVWILEGF